MPVIDIGKVAPNTDTIYPAPYCERVVGRSSIALGDAGGLSQFGVRITILEPGCQSSLRHWHVNQDEFAMVTEGEITLVDDHGDHLLHPGDCAAFPAGDENGHHFVNRSNARAGFLVVGTRTPSETAWYADIDMKVEQGDGVSIFTRRDGSPLPDTA